MKHVPGKSAQALIIVAWLAACGPSEPDNLQVGPNNADVNNGATNNAEPRFTTNNSSLATCEPPQNSDRSQLGLSLAGARLEGSATVTSVAADGLQLDDEGEVVEFFWEGDDLRDYFSEGDLVEYEFEAILMMANHTAWSHTIVSSPTATAEVSEFSAYEFGAPAGFDITSKNSGDFSAEYVQFHVVSSPTSSSACLSEFDCGSRVDTRATHPLRVRFLEDDVELVLEPGNGAEIAGGWVHHVDATTHTEVSVEGGNCGGDDSIDASATFVKVL